MEIYEKKTKRGRNIFYFFPGKKMSLKII